MNIYCHHTNCELENHIVRLWPRPYFKIAKSSLCLLCVSLCIFSLNHDTRSKKTKQQQQKVVVCCCWKKFNLLLDFLLRNNPRDLSTFEWKGGEASVSVVKQTASKLKSNNKPWSKTTQICLPWLNQKNKKPLLFRWALFSPQPEYYSVWLRSTVTVCQTLSISLNATRNNVLSQIFPEIQA